MGTEGRSIWTIREEEILRDIVTQHGGIGRARSIEEWRALAGIFNARAGTNRTGAALITRWSYVSRHANPNMRNGMTAVATRPATAHREVWTADDDAQLDAAIHDADHARSVLAAPEYWALVAFKLNNRRTPRACEERMGVRKAKTCAPAEAHPSQAEDIDLRHSAQQWTMESLDELRRIRKCVDALCEAWGVTVPE